MCGRGVLSEQKLASWSAAVCASGAGTGASPRRASVACHEQREVAGASEEPDSPCARESMDFLLKLIAPLTNYRSLAKLL